VAETAKETPSIPATDTFEKTPLSSKKFIAYLVADIGWSAFLAFVLLVYQEQLTPLVWGLLMGTVLVKGFVQVGVILGQNSLDKFIRVARINATLGVPTVLEGPTKRKSTRPEKGASEKE